VNGVLFDFGLSSFHLEAARRGFSFQKDEPLDMRFDKDSKNPTAAQILSSAREEELALIFRKFGEERFSKDIARAVAQARRKERLATTKELVALILSVYRGRLRSKKEVPWIGGIHPATRVFQALRIAVNKELENLEKVLPDAVEALAPEGRIAVISFHSLEDRIVKHFFRSRADLKILTKKPITPGAEEIKANPRARSAKLRAAVKV
jgi:16S rRNA (cytosine1402-N4)-methyltransferase